MTELFRRYAEVTVGDTLLKGFRVQFKVEKSLAPEPNTVDVAVTNLSAETRAALQQKGAQLVLVAGYEDTAEVLFVGDVRYISHVHTSADWVSRFQCGDGGAAFAGARTVESFGPGTPVRAVVERLARDLKVGVGNAVDEAKKGDFRKAFDSFVNGVTLSGRSSDELTTLMRSAGLEWSIQDGHLQVLRPGATTAEGVVVLASGDGLNTGLVGSPEFGEKGILKAKALLQPGLRPGREVLLESATATGRFRIEKATHTGDLAGQDWYTEVELARL